MKISSQPNPPEPKGEHPHMKKDNKEIKKTMEELKEILKVVNMRVIYIRQNLANVRC